MGVTSGWLLAPTILFWIALALLLWTWLGFPLILQVLVWGKQLFTIPQPCPDGTEFTPSVTILIGVHNEERVIRERVENCLAADYPHDKLQVVIASDQSDDGTEAIVESFSKLGVNLVRSNGQGKSMAQNQSMSAATGEIVVFSDADTRFAPSFISRMVDRFRDDRIGCVSGRVVWTNRTDSLASRTGGRYWRYEHYLWGLEEALGVPITASGPCMAIRRGLFKPIEPYFGDDVIVPYDVMLQGYRVAFARDALVYEEYFEQLRASMRSRVRMSMRGFAATMSRWRLLNPIRYPGQCITIISHKLMRWMTPYFLLLLLISSIALMRIPRFRIVAWAQALFYFVALVGFLLDRRSVHVPVVSGVYSFCAMNAAILVGVSQALLGRRMFSYRA